MEATISIQWDNITRFSFSSTVLEGRRTVVLRILLSSIVFASYRMARNECYLLTAFRRHRAHHKDVINNIF